MFFRLFLLFALVPVVELALLIQVGQLLGVVPTVVLVLGTGAAGAALARSQGMQAFTRLKVALSSGAFPGEEIIDGALILGGGLLLLTPGILTDVVGFAVLIPGSRQFVKSLVKRAVRQRLHPGPIRVDYDVH